MSNLIQIIYISRSTFVRTANASGIEPNVGRILQKSRINNQKNGLVGVLYFGDDCFFQCLEGEQAAVDALYAKLESDTRHKDIKLISRKNIGKLSFAEWAMKYVPLDKEMNRLMQKNGYANFDPYKFDNAMTAQVMNLLYKATDPNAATETATGTASSGIGKWIMVAAPVAVLAAVAFFALR